MRPGEPLLSAQFLAFFPAIGGGFGRTRFVLIVAIDGPAGSGKSTTARAVAQALGFLYLDTGAMYRAMALAFLRADEPPTEGGAAAVLKGTSIDVRHEGGEMRVLLNGEDVSRRIRAQDAGQVVSRISALPAVREKMVAEQRRIARERVAAEGGVVLDGRDIGTVVFPDADVKIFLVADVEERARRRLAERREQGEEASLEEVKREIEARDRADRERSLAPLRRAEDAVELDTTDRTVSEQVQVVVEHVRERQRRASG